MYIYLISILCIADAAYCNFSIKETHCAIRVLCFLLDECNIIWNYVRTYFIHRQQSQLHSQDKHNAPSETFKRFIIICVGILIFIRKKINLARGKSSQGADLLTDPGEYENLPFHGLQTAPNKVSFKCKSEFNHSILVCKFI